MPKKISVYCFGPVAASRKYQSLWEDVWLSWTGKPGRKKYRLAPCLCSRLATERDHQWNLELQAENLDGSWDTMVEETRLALEAIDAGKIYIGKPSCDLTDVYSPKELIDRAEAERMIAEVMKLHGFKSIRCKWKRPKIIAIPA